MNKMTTRMFAMATWLSLGTAALVAQTAPASPPAPTEDKETIKMEPFVVNTDTDKGYVAVDSLAGGRTNTPIKLTPSSMSSITRTFIDDLGLTDVRGALAWTPNVVPEDRNAGKGFGGAAFHDWAYNFRGAGAGEQGGPGPNRNYFSFFQNADSYNVERFEFDRGPNSIIFGLGTVGGTMSIYTKVPRTDKDFFTPAVQFDNNGSARLELDLNRRLTDKVTMRLNALENRFRGWQKNDRLNQEAVDLSLLYKPADNTSVRVEGEFSKRRNTLFGSVLGDKVSGWDGTTASQTWGATPTGGSARTEHMQNAGAWGDWLSPFWVYVPQLGSKSLMAWAGGWASTTSQTETWAALNFQPYKGWYPAQVKLPWHTSYASTANVPVMPSRDFTYGDGVNDINYKDLTVSLDHKINENLDATVAGYRYTDDQVAKDYEATGGAAIDINKQLPDGTSNPNYGKAFMDFFLSKQTQKRSVSEGRIQFNYHFDSTLFGKSWKQLISVAAATKDQRISARQYLGQVANAGPDWPQNMVWGRLYMDAPNQLMNAPEIAPNGKAIVYSPKADGYWFDFDDTFKVRDFAVMSHSRLLDDKLSILLGARNDHYTEHLRELRRGPNLTDNIVDESQSGTTYSAGGTYYFNWIGLFANYSKNIQPPHPGSQPYLTGARPSPENGKGVDFGVRISTDDGRYYAQISRYQTKSTGHLVENPIGIRNIWQKYNVAQGLPSDGGNGNIAFSDTTALDVKGYELDLTGNPTKNLRLQATYGKPDATIVDYYPMSRAYVNSNLSTWNSVVNNGALDASKRNDLRAAIADVQNALAQAVPGAKQQGLVKYTASVFANYTFTNDALKGFSVGAGVTNTGRSFAGVLDGKEYYGSSVSTTHAVIAYETKYEKMPVRIALNIDNVLDKKDPIITSYHWGYTDPSGTHIADGFYLPAPRVIRLSARLTF